MKNIDKWYKGERYECEKYLLKKNVFTHSIHTKTREYIGQKEGDIITVLFLKDEKYGSEIVMSNSVMEIRTNQEVMEKAKGKVLIGGMGISMITKALQEKAEVTDILIVEKDKELIDFFLPLIKEKLEENVEIINEDIFNYKPKEKFDTIYFDIWNEISGENYEEMQVLEKRYRKHLVKGGYISSWRKRDCLVLSRGGCL